MTLPLLMGRGRWWPHAQCSDQYLAHRKCLLNICCYLFHHPYLLPQLFPSSQDLQPSRRSMPTSFSLHMSVLTWSQVASVTEVCSRHWPWWCTSREETCGFCLPRLILTFPSTQAACMGSASDLRTPWSLYMTCIPRFICLNLMCSRLLLFLPKHFPSLRQTPLSVDWSPDLLSATNIRTLWAALLVVETFQHWLQVCMCQPQSPSSSHPRFALISFVSICLFSTSVSVVLLCKIRLSIPHFSFL